MSHSLTLRYHNKAFTQPDVTKPNRNDTYLEYTTPQQHIIWLDRDKTVQDYTNTTPRITLPYLTKALCKGTTLYLNTTFQHDTVPQHNKYCAVLYPSGAKRYSTLSTSQSLYWTTPYQTFRNRNVTFLYSTVITSPTPYATDLHLTIPVRNARHSATLHHNYTARHCTIRHHYCTHRPIPLLHIRHE